MANNTKSHEREQSAARWRMPRLIAAILVIGCASDSSPAARSSAVLRDSAGVTIVENSMSASLPEWRVTEALFSPISDADGAGPRSLHRVSAAVRLNDGGIAVANGSSGEIRVFDDTGEYRTSFGRTGSGPGEFRALSLFAWRPGDTMVVFDAGLRRVTVLQLSSGIVREQALPGDAGSVVAVLPDGGLISSMSLVANQPTDGLVRARDELRLLSASGERLRILGEHASRERIVSASSQGAILMTPPFARRTAYAAFGDGYLVADQASPEYRVYDRDGTLRRIVRTGGEVTPVTKADVDAHVRRALENAPPDRHESIRAGLEAMSLPPHLPAFGDVRVARDSTVWLSDFPEPGTEQSRWSVYDPSGAAVARVTLPDRAVVLDAGAEWVLFLGRDALDVEAVHLRRLVRE